MIRKNKIFWLQHLLNSVCNQNLCFHQGMLSNFCFYRKDLYNPLKVQTSVSMYQCLNQSAIGDILHCSKPKPSLILNTDKSSKNMNLFMRKPFFSYAKTKTQISFAVTAKLISAFVFATRIVQSLFFLNLKFQASRNLL